MRNEVNSVYEEKRREYYSALQQMQQVIRDEMRFLEAGDIDPGYVVLNAAETLIRRNSQLRGVCDVLREKKEE